MAMKKLMTLLLTFAAFGSVSAQSGKAVMAPEGYPVAGYVFETTKRIYGQQAEGAWFQKSEGYYVKTLYAEKGEGILMPIGKDYINIRQKPTTDSKVVRKWLIPEDEVPAFYDCMGKVGNWYKLCYDLDDNGNPIVGYVRADIAEWAPYDMSVR